MNIIAETALASVGYTEEANNDNKFGKYFGQNNQSWCMYFVQWVYTWSRVSLPYFTGSCSTLLNWYKKNQPECVFPYGTKEVIPEGSIVIYGWGHTGIVLCRWPSYIICTVEGNTNPTPKGSQTNGEGVFVRNRIPAPEDYFIVPRELRKLDEEEELMPTPVKYTTIEEVPSWARECVQRLLDLGALTSLNLTNDMCRIFVVMDRLGLIPSMGIETPDDKNN